MLLIFCRFQLFIYDTNVVVHRRSMRKTYLTLYENAIEQVSENKIDF